MVAATKPPQRVLAVDLSSRGFGFVVVEGPRALVDWGTRQVNRDKCPRTITKVGTLLQLYRPDVLVLEDTARAGSRRCRRIRLLIDEVAHHARARHVRVALISVATVRKVFALSGATTKHQIAGVVAEQLPELAPQRPPPRKPWMREDDRMAIFDATAFALTFYSA